MQRGLPGVAAEEERLPSEAVLSGELMGERRREARRGLLGAMGPRPATHTAEEWAVALSLLSPSPLPPGSAGARAALAVRARACFPGLVAPAALRAYLEHRDRPHVAALVADFRALEGLDVMAQRGLWRERLDLAGEALAEKLRPRQGETLQAHLAMFEPADVARLATAMATVAKVAADFDALQAPRASPDDAPPVDPRAAQADAHKALAANLERVAADLAARAGST